MIHSVLQENKTGQVGITFRIILGSYFLELCNSLVRTSWLWNTVQSRHIISYYYCWFIFEVCFLSSLLMASYTFLLWTRVLGLSIQQPCLTCTGKLYVQRVPQNFMLVLGKLLLVINGEEKNFSEQFKWKVSLLSHFKKQVSEWLLEISLGSVWMCLYTQL